MNLLHNLLSTSRGKLGMSLLALVALMLSGCTGGGGSDTPPPPAAPTLTSIAISPTATIIKVGATASYTATGTYSDGTTANITSTVTWTSSLTGVATFTAGVATGVAAGTTTITASYGGKTSTDAALTVITLDSIAITPAAATVNEGGTTSFTATGTYSNGTTENITSQVAWTSSLTGVATIDLATGVATGATGGATAGGPTTITATASGGIILNTATLNVIASTVTLGTIDVLPAAPQTTPKGVPFTFTAMGTFSDASSGDISGSVTWFSSNDTVATVNASGIASALAEGTADIHAESGVASSTPVTLTVTAPALATLTITPTPASVTVGNTKQFTVSGTLTDGSAATDFSTVTWAFDSPVATIDPNTGLATGDVTGLAPGALQGNANISATCATCTPTVNSNTSVLTVSLGQIGGARQGRQLSLTPTPNIFAGSGGTGNIDNVDGLLATFSSPGSITTDGTNLYVADVVNHTIRKIVISSGEVTTLAGSAGFFGASNATGTNASFKFPEGITTDGTNLYVADTGNHLIRKIAPASGTLSAMTDANAVVTTLAGSGAAGADNGTGTAATFWSPRGITVDDSGNLYVADTTNNKIRKIVIASGVVSDFATGLSAPRGLTTDGTNLYIANTGGNAILRMPIGGGVVTPLASGLSAPYGLTTDGTDLYFADNGSDTIFKMPVGGGVPATLTTLITTPHGITTDGTSLFVVDNVGNTISKID